MFDKKIRKTIACLLCFVMSWMSVVPVYATNPVISNGVDEEEILARYPNAKIIHVEPEDYPQLAEQLRNQGYQAATPSSVTHLANNESFQTNG